MFRRITSAITAWRGFGIVGVLLVVALGGFFTARLLAGSDTAPASAAVASTDTSASTSDVYSAEEALKADGYVWDEAEGFFVGTGEIADMCTTTVYTSACTDGAEEKPKPRLDPNGCGPGWLPGEVMGAGDHPGGFDFRAACNEHDKCYSTYPIPKPNTPDQWKAKCDDAFDAALKKYCDSVVGAKIADKYKFVWEKGKLPKWVKIDEEIKWPDEAAQKHCHFWRTTYVNAVKSKLGNNAFNEAQEAAKKAAEGDGGETTTSTTPSTTTTYSTTTSTTTSTSTTPATTTTYSTTTSTSTTPSTTTTTYPLR